MCMEKRIAQTERRTLSTKNPPHREGHDQVYYHEHDPFHQKPERRDPAKKRRTTDPWNSLHERQQKELQ